jgi:hypothetical protein
MRTKLFFDEVDASVNQTSAVFQIDCGQDMRFLMHVIGTDLTSPVRFIIEESFDNLTWSALEDTSTWEDYFTADTQLIAIKDSYFMGEYMRVKIVANGNTTGSITAKMGYKTKV